MGMFDDVNFEMDCPTCGKYMSGFQSKDGACDLDVIEPDSVDKFYASCRNCGSWVEFSKARPEIQGRETKLTLNEVLEIGFEMQVTKKD